MFAAIKARAANPAARILLVDKGYPGRSGCSVFAAGVFPYWMPGDENVEEQVREIIEDNAEYLIDQDYVRTALRESYHRFLDLKKWGVEFATDEQGQVKRIPTLSIKNGFCSPFPGGMHLMARVKSEALRLGVRMLERIMITDLVIEDGVCTGAVGFGIRDGQGFIFQAKGTVLAAGSFMANFAPMGACGGTGDGIALGLRAGLALRNTEQLKPNYGPRGLASPGLHVIFGHGGILVNARGERFMEGYSPKLKEETRRFDTARAILHEWKEGRGPCYLDCTHLSPSALDAIKKALPLVMQGLKAKGYDIARDRVEYVPYPLSLLNYGGVKINNANGEVGLQGLWVVGAAGDYCGGADSTAVTALPGSSLQGARAGRLLGRYIKQRSTTKLDDKRAHSLLNQVFAPLKNKVRGGLSSDALILKVEEVVFRHINIFRAGDGLRLAIKKLDELNDMLVEVSVEDGHHLQKFHNVKNMVEVAQVIARACLIRRESRRAHFRLDYPKRDDQNWLKWILARKRDGKIQYYTEDFPLQRWKYKPQ